MTKIRLILVLILSIPFLLKGQSNFKQGYFIDNSSDTIKGYMDYREWDKSPKEIRFKKSLKDNTVQTLSPDYIQSFEILGLDRFISSNTKISLDPIELSLVGHLDTSFEKKSIFLKVLIKGPKCDLLEYTDNIKTRFFYLKSGDREPVELVYRLFYKSEDPQSLETQKTFRDQLEYLSASSGIHDPKIDQKIKGAEYYASSLSPLFNLINGQAKNSQTAGNSSYRPFLGMAVNLSQLSFSGLLPLTGQSSSVYPEIRGGWDYLFNKTTQKTLFRYEFTAGYHSYSLNQTVPGTGSVPISQNNSFSTKGLHFSLSPRLVYNIFNSTDLKIFGSTGVLMKYSLYSAYGITTVTANFGSSTQSNYPPLNQLSFLIPIQIGFVVHKNLEFNANYLSSTLSQTLGYTVKEQSILVGFNYLFKY